MHLLTPNDPGYKRAIALVAKALACRDHQNNPLAWGLLTDSRRREYISEAAMYYPVFMTGQSFVPYVPGEIPTLA